MKLLSNHSAKSVRPTLLHFWFQELVPIELNQCLRLNNQQDASSIQNFILSRNSTCFGHILCPSSGVISCTRGNWHVSCRLCGPYLGESGWNLTVLGESGWNLILLTPWVMLLLGGGGTKHSGLPLITLPTYKLHCSRLRKSWHDSFILHWVEQIMSCRISVGS
jgi:hypothetical protein